MTTTPLLLITVFYMYQIFQICFLPSFTADLVLVIESENFKSIRLIAMFYSSQRNALCVTREKDRQVVS